MSPAQPTRLRFLRRALVASGLAAALSVLIFIIVAVISGLGFKYTKTFEEAR